MANERIEKFKKNAGSVVNSALIIGTLAFGVPGIIAFFMKQDVGKIIDKAPPKIQSAMNTYQM